MTSKKKAPPSDALEGYQPNYESLDMVDWAKSHNTPLIKTADFTWSLTCPWVLGHTDPTTPPATLVQIKGGYPDLKCDDPACANNIGTKPIMALWSDAMSYCSGPFPPKVPGEDVVSPHDPNWKSPAGKVQSPYGHFINALGFDGENNYWYQTGPFGHVIKLHLGSHKELPLQGLVPLRKFWYAFAGNAATGKIDWNAAASQLIGECHAKGHFRPEHVRGVGLWWDEDRIVANLGNRLIVDGVETKIFDIRGDYFYDSNHKGVPLVAPASDEALRGMLPLINRLPFAEKSGAAIMTGMAIAGLMPTLLKWRPQVWIYGAQGSGKTQVMRHVLGAIWGGVFGSQCQLEGVTSEPAIRQIIGNSAISITADDQEVEEDDRSGMIRINSMIKLARSSASESDASTGKGSGSGGRAMLYYIRACFAFNSISCPIEKPQDKERFFAIGIKPQIPGKMDMEYPAVAAEFKEKFNKAFALSIFSRLINDAPKVLKIIESFTHALMSNGEKYGLKRRYCDQWGVAIGIAWWTQNPSAVDVDAETAIEFFASYYERAEYEQQVVSESGPAGERALRHLLDWIPHERGGAVSVAEMIDEVAHLGGSKDRRTVRYDQSYESSSDSWLRRYGMLVKGDAGQAKYLWVAMGHGKLKSRFSEGGIMNYPSALASYHGAKRVDKHHQFITLARGYVMIPLAEIFKIDPPMDESESFTAGVTGAAAPSFGM